MLFRCEDLERYVTETSQEKMNLILINKADFLSERQRQDWASYFDTINLRVAFFSALEENQNNQLRKMKLLAEEEEEDDECNSLGESDEEEIVSQKLVGNDQSAVIASPPVVEKVKINDETTNQTNEEARNDTPGKNSSQLLNRDELINLFKTVHEGRRIQEDRAVVGLVGYPNVGKSSTINSLLTYKKVSVSATPGKTKHFQVLKCTSILSIT